jgi:hypothetical protein
MMDHAIIIDLDVLGNGAIHCLKRRQTLYIRELCKHDGD